MGQAQQVEHKDVEKRPHKYPLELKPQTLLQIGIGLVELHVPQMGHVDHMLVALVGIDVIQLMSIVHKASFRMGEWDSAPYYSKFRHQMQGRRQKTFLSVNFGRFSLLFHHGVGIMESGIPIIILESTLCRNCILNSGPWPRPKPPMR